MNIFRDYRDSKEYRKVKRAQRLRDRVAVLSGGDQSVKRTSSSSKDMGSKSRRSRGQPPISFQSSVQVIFHHSDWMPFPII